MKRSECASPNGSRKQWSGHPHLLGSISNSFLTSIHRRRLVRVWCKQVKSEDLKRARGECTRCPNRRDPRSKNLCRRCLTKQRGVSRERRRAGGVFSFK